MSVARPSQCIFCSFSQTVRRSGPPARRKFHSSIPQMNRKPKFPSIKARDVDLADPKPWSKKEKSELNKRYSPEQIAAIEAAESTIPKEALTKATIRADPWALTYFDDLTQIDPVVDKPVRAPWTNIDHNTRLKTVDEMSTDVAKFIQNFPEDEKDRAAAWEEFQNLRVTVGREESERNPRYATAPAIGSSQAERVAEKSKFAPGGENRNTEEPTPALVRLMQMTGLDAMQIRRLRVKTIIAHGVVNQTRLGKIRKTYFLSVAGNGQGLIGIGEGKAEDANDARLQSQYRAIRNMQPVLRYENRTIYGDVKGKVSATELELYARPPGFGLRCQEYIWEICQCAGIFDLGARVTRSRNPMNTVKAAVAALLSQKNPEDIARARGKKLVDVRRVYYAGQT